MVLLWRGRGRAGVRNDGRVGVEGVVGLGGATDRDRLGKTS